MKRIESISELNIGDVVWLFGAPFARDVQKYNPFKVIRNYDFPVEVLFLTQQSWSDITQGTTGIYSDTYIFREEPSAADWLVLMLDGVCDDIQNYTST